MKAKNVVQPVAIDPRSAVYHLKVYILNISPMIYRRFVIDGNTNIAELHHLIQMMIAGKTSIYTFFIFGEWNMELLMKAVPIIVTIPVRFTLEI
ncbi:IS1096 element passenger TnpR family protein [Dyadobacter sp. 3J3]|uniref:IS1096 element passenger TnpR family protein n=1 Tax=Dyadobacter sp. 3J3 TaxID=2606600 RepID=UPI001357EE14